jgi:uncharacterized protein YbaR (Trm112 family)
MPAQTLPETTHIPLVSCPSCAKKPLMVIKSVNPRGRGRDANVEFICAACGLTHTEPTTL